MPNLPDSGRAARGGLLASIVLVALTALLVAGGFVLAGILPAPFAAAASSPPPLREFTLTAEEIEWEIMAGVTVRAWGYNGQMPGPEIRVREGDRVRITLHNQLPVGTTIHWHGLDVPPAMDGPVGLNQAAVDPGETFVYEFVATPAGTRWYHAHADPKVQIALGLYGPIIVEPREPVQTYDREYTYLLNEWDLELTPDVAMGKAPLGPRDAQLRGGELGTDLFLMNGHAHESIPPVTLAEGERVLLRLINAGNLPHAVHTHGHAFTIVATDGNPVPEAAQLRKDTVLIGPGERYDLALEGTKPGVWMFHCHMEHHADNGMMTLIQYDGARPTGPVAEYWDASNLNQSASAPPEAMGHHGAHDAPAVITEPSHDAELTAPPPAAESSAPPSAGLAPAVVEVALVDDRFDPPELTVAAGTTLQFVNRGANWHSVAAFDGSFDSGRLEPGQQFSVTLDVPGEYQFICQHHGLRGMTGRVIVTA